MLNILTYVAKLNNINWESNGYNHKIALQMATKSNTYHKIWIKIDRWMMDENEERVVYLKLSFIYIVCFL